MHSEEFFEDGIAQGGDSRTTFRSEPSISGICLNKTTPTGMFVSHRDTKDRYIITTAWCGSIAMKIVKENDEYWLDCIKLGDEDIDFGNLFTCHEIDFFSQGSYCWDAKIELEGSVLAVTCTPHLRDEFEITLLIPQNARYTNVYAVPKIASI